MKRIVLSILAITCAFCLSLGCVDSSVIADQPIGDTDSAESSLTPTGPTPCPPGWIRGSDGNCHPLPSDPWPDPPPEKLGSGANGIGTSPDPADVWWRPWCPPYCEPGPTDTTGIAAVDAGP